MSKLDFGIGKVENINTYLTGCSIVRVKSQIGNFEVGNSLQDEFTKREFDEAKQEEDERYETILHHEQKSWLITKLLKKKTSLIKKNSSSESNCSEDVHSSEPPIDNEQYKVNNPSRERQEEEEGEPIDEDVDGGYAWIILAVVFIINASTLGTARAYGLIFERLARQDEQSRSQAALPFTIMGSVENMGGPLTSYLLAKTQSWRTTVFIGSILICLAHFLAAFCDSVLGQLLIMGLMCGLGLSLVTISFFQINNAYFVRYRSRAFGLGLTGAVLGTFYISPICKFVLDTYDTSTCYLMLCLILFPNVPLSLLLRQKRPQQNSKGTIGRDNCKTSSSSSKQEQPLSTISGQIELADSGGKTRSESKLWANIKSVLTNPIFHLIWPTQLLFCWFNFVFGMILVDFAKDCALDDKQASDLIPIWALGQLVGRLGLGSLADWKFLSYQLLTVICFASISLTTWALNNITIQGYEVISTTVLVFILSMFISNLYILFNGLVVIYMDKSLTALSIGISSFAGSFFLLPRANIIGYYRDTIGNYNAMLTMFTYVSMLAAIVWLLVPSFCSWFRCCRSKRSDRAQSRARLFRENSEIRI